MNNEKKYREIAKFCLKQKADLDVASTYREMGPEKAIDVVEYCNLLRWVLNPYAESLIDETLYMQKDEDVAKAKEAVDKYGREGFTTKLAFVGDYNYAKDAYGVVINFHKKVEKSIANMSMTLVVPYGELLQFSETLNQWFTK